MTSKTTNVLLTSRRCFDILKPLKSIISNYNQCVARRNLKHYPQIAIFAFDHIGLAINVEGRYENQHLCLIRQFLEELIPDSLKKVALDIGANIGNHSIFFSDLFSEVYAYEPNPCAFALLEINSRLCSMNKNIRCRNYGLSNQAASVLIEVDRSNLGKASIVFENGVSVGPDTFLVDVRRADQISELHEKEISLIKIDVEGHELLALKGAEELLKKNMPVILFEQKAGEINNDTSPTIRYLEGLNYQFASITRNFYFGENPLLRLISLILRSVLGTQLKIVKTGAFDKKYYNMIIAVPEAKEYLGSG